MSELTWYGRFAVLVGAAVLLVQSVAGRGAGLMSLASVVLMAGGLLGFLAGLVWDARQERRSEENEAPATEASGISIATSEPEPTEIGPPGADSPTLEESREPSRAEEAAEEPDVVLDAKEVEVVAPRAVQPPISPRAQHRGVETREIAAGSWLADITCVRCSLAFGVGAVIALCPVCDRPQHASCWIENRFRCSTPGCSGHGSLEAPAPQDEE
jgi:hypothetical protein